MLKATFTPIFHIIPAKSRPPNLSRRISSALAHTPPSVRQNAHPTSPQLTHLTSSPQLKPTSTSHSAENAATTSTSQSSLSAHPRPRPTTTLESPTTLMSYAEKSKLHSQNSATTQLLKRSSLEGPTETTPRNEILILDSNAESLGVPAFQDELLKSCGRAHGVEEVHEAIGIVGSCGFGNWSMDLISSVPHQTPEMWEQSLRLTIDARPTHVSVYDLQVEQGTKFGILSYCKSSFECKHNLTYWESKPFYGFGLGSASYLNGLRFSRPWKMKEYMDYMQNLEDGVVEHHKDYFPDAKDMATDAVMLLSFRTAKGLDFKAFKETFGSSLVHSLCKAYGPYVDSGHVICLDQQRKTITADQFFSLLSDGHEIEKTGIY
ncbi:radical SAM superfamily protein [Actinidia rufa]|uniref:Radical SAM superfamily protein n=1 Tax=Actinidia rufa TaxID=165716 RepID=A0A7J0GMQ4_9ERIC|nr:radical SAM superfamily protein [Actinidia rufa]